MKNIKKIMLLVLIIIIAITIIIIAINKNYVNRKPNDFIGDKPEIINTEDISILKDTNTFFTISYAIQDYLNYINNQNREAVYSILNNDYKQNNDITEENLFNKVNFYNEPQSFSPKKIYEKKSEHEIYKYLVNGEIVNKQKLLEEKGKEYNVIVIMDYKNMTFSIIPYSGQDINILQEISEKNIEPNTYNKYSYQTMDNQRMGIKLLSDYVKKVNVDIEDAYNYLDDEYKRMRFGSIDEYKKYIQNNINEIKSIRMSEYLVNNYNDYTEYVCKDQYGNLYIFKETAVMQYTLTLDTYTLENEKFTTTYEKSNDQKKVMMNVDKFFQMLNARDYKTSYEILDSGFKNNYFNTQEVYENYMRSAFPDHYKVEYTGFSNEGNILIQKVKLTSMENNTTMEKNIIMKLEEGTKFVMSFNIQ